MIKVLQDKQEITNAIQWLQARDLLQHTEKSKNFDLAAIYTVLDSKSKNISVVDLGCGVSKYGCVTLNSLAKAGFKNLLGIDMYVPWYARVATWIAHIRLGIWKNPYILKQGNICQTKLPSSSVDFAILLSVIEHGVPLEDLMKELARIIKSGGKVYISTDYWPSDNSMTEMTFISTGSYGNIPMPWKIFSLEDIRKLIELANKAGFELKTPVDIPAVKDKPVSWHGHNYTFISLVLEKSVMKIRDKGDK